MLKYPGNLKKNTYTGSKSILFSINSNTGRIFAAIA